MSECIFCKIIKGEIPGRKVYEDEHILAIHDLNPAAPVHILVMPKEHIASIASISDRQISVVAHIHSVIRNIAHDLKLQEGYRIVNNCGVQGGQTVDHLHFHLLGGRSFAWPPG